MPPHRIFKKNRKTGVRMKISALEIIFCAFLPLKGVLKRVAESYFVKVLIPFIGVRRFGFYASVP